MKKKVLRVIAGATLMVVMAVGMQVNNVQNESSLVMENLEALAMAYPEMGDTYACVYIPGWGYCAKDKLMFSRCPSYECN
ncbi:MAG: hypothetical protein JEZ14_14205 [Marinilabiliaceae bacterium]|nr:hypothetical protein [Marinilabiliaceae bacterium]